jgi:glyoxylate reductase
MKRTGEEAKAGLRSASEQAMSTVFVSRPIPAVPLQRLLDRHTVSVGSAERPTTAAELRDACREARGLVAMLTDRIDAAFLDSCPGLEVVANFAVGVNNVDLTEAEARGVWVTNTPDVLTDATADLAFALLLACSRRLPQAERELREGRWLGWSPLHGHGLPCRRLGIVGMGRIGQAMAKRAEAFGLEVAHASPREHARFRRMELDALLAWADVVSLHCPLTEATRHLLDASRLAKMRPGAILINTSRGPVVDEKALGEALSSGALGAAGIDVFENEPSVHPALLSAPNALLVPHIGSATAEAREAMGMRAVDGVLDVLAGQEPTFAVVRPKVPRAARR